MDFEKIISERYSKYPYDNLPLVCGEIFTLL